MATSESGDLEHSRSRLADGTPSQRVTVRVPNAQLRRLESLVESGSFPNRSEAVRVAIRELTAEARGEESD